jgi:hypothetical protein
MNNTHQRSLSQQAKQLRRAELSRATNAVFAAISDAMRVQHENLLRRWQSRELLKGTRLRSTIGTPA